ncbi:MAG: hypothetical protein JWM47_2619 [Acidimicrobiales bacterium]|nr:hypothetical protein [Acidimicrobiales bacterium]
MSVPKVDVHVDGVVRQPDRRPRPRLRCGAAVLLMALALAACSSGSDAGPASLQTEGTTGAELPSTSAAPSPSESPGSGSPTTAPDRTVAGTAEADSFTIGLPQGWEQAEANETTDLYVKHATLPDVELAVRSSPMAGGAAAATESLEGQREVLEGYTNTDEVTEATEVDAAGDGAQAFDWLFTADGSDGTEAQFHQRRIMIARGAELYDVTFQAPEARFDELEADLTLMLESWDFA